MYRVSEKVCNKIFFSFRVDRYDFDPPILVRNLRRLCTFLGQVVNFSRLLSLDRFSLTFEHSIGDTFARNSQLATVHSRIEA